MKKLAAIFGILLLSSVMLIGCGGNKPAETPATEAAPANEESKEAVPAADAPAADAPTDAPATDTAPAAN